METDKDIINSLITRVILLECAFASLVSKDKEAEIDSKMFDYYYRNNFDSLAIAFKNDHSENFEKLVNNVKKFYLENN